MRSLPRMPRELKKSLYSLQDKHNLNKMQLLSANEIVIEDLGLE